ncbi:hypothetical protein QBC41DRAFT_39051 [Cercophora samala]|uniref:Transmembrane protein n=1 Tax=Cercophora samala TaxID=330535 RepID=A0AA39ZJA3_9PEZI|nr:hypothetical protein QBC41DRAFT_39051 [Cercophora samala]
MASTTIPPKSSRPTSPVMAQPPNTITTAALNPGMVYAPLSTRADSLIGTSSFSFSSSSDSNGKRYKLATPFTTALRVILIVLTIADIVVWLSGTFFSTGTLIFGHIWLWVLLFWNLVHVRYPLFCKKFGGPPRINHRIPCLPTILLQIGDCACVLNDSDSNSDDEETGVKKKKKTGCGLGWAVDIVLGVPSIVVASSYWGWLYESYDEHARALSHAVGALSIFVGLFSIVTARRLIIFQMGLVIKSLDEEHEGPGGQYNRIRLPVDTSDRRTAGIVSFSA